MTAPMNRETKRMLKRQGQLGADGQPVAAPRQQQAALAPRKRTPLPQFLREVRGELAKVSWPTRPEVKKFVIVVLVALVVMTAVTASLDFVFSKFVFFLFDR
jgi:preprotein translocase subunit SecE